MRRLVSALALASILVLVASSSVLAADTHLVRVSRGDPFANCLLGGNDFGGVNYRSAEVEPFIADNPANTANVVGTWQQDRWSDGGAKGQVASWSFDAGRTWGQTPQPFTLCAQPFYGTPVLQYQRTSDPWVSIGPDGTAYAVSLPFDGDSSATAWERRSRTTAAAPGSTSRTSTRWSLEPTPSTLATTSSR